MPIQPMQHKRASHAPAAAIARTSRRASIFIASDLLCSDTLYEDNLALKRSQAADEGTLVSDPNVANGAWVLGCMMRAYLKITSAYFFQLERVRI